MRIAQVSAHTSPLAPPGGTTTGGMNVYVLGLSRELARLGYEIDIFTRLDGDLPAVEELAPNLRLVRIEAGPAAPIDKEAIIGYLPDFTRNMRGFIARQGMRYDAIHSHYWQSGRVGTLLARELRVPHVVMFHTLGEVKNRARISEQEPKRRIRHERMIARRATAIVTASAHERLLLERYYGADPARMHTIPCGIDTDRFRPLNREASRRKLGLSEGRPVVIWVGRLERLKGIDILIGALAQLETHDFTLLIVGGDEGARTLRAELEAQAAEAGIGANLRFAGPVPHDELPAYYSAADVCAVPSYYESFGLAAVEAMACGTPVVASRVGGLVSTVTDGVSGYLIPWRCPEPFAEKLEVLFGNPELRANFGRAARQSVTRFRWETVALDIAAVYDRAMSDYRARTGMAATGGFGKEVYEAAVVAGGLH